MPSVPPAQIVPADIRTSYFERSIAGAAISAMIVTAAPTMPVAAANNVAVKIVAMNSAPCTRPNSSCTARKSRVIRPALSSRYPMNVNSATAASTVSIIVSNT